MSINKNNLPVGGHLVRNRMSVLKENDLALPVYSYSHDNDLYKKERTFDFFKILSTLFHRKWTVILTTLLFLLIALFISSSIKPAFKASTTLEIARNSFEVIGFGNISASGDDQEFYSTQYGLLTSPSLASQVIKDLRLTAAQLSSSSNTSDEILKTKTMEELFLSNLTISPVPKSRLVKISYENSNPKLASEIANSLSENFILSNIVKKRDATSYTREFLNGSVIEVRKKLEDSELLLEDYASTNKLLKFDEAQSVKLNALEKLEEMVALAQGDLIDAKSNQQHARSSGGNKDLVNNTTIQALKQQKLELVSNYQELLQTFKPNYPQMQQLQKRINKVEQEISLERNSIVSFTRISTNNSYEASKEKVGKLNDKVNQVKKELMLVQNKSVKYDNLKREVLSNQELYTTLLRRLNEVTVAGDVAVNNISIISKAAIPLNKIRPRGLLNLIAGTLLGLFTGSLIALFLEVTRGRIRSEDDLKQVANLPILGKIPKIKAIPRRDTSLLIHSKVKSPLPEAIRLLRTNLTHAVGQKSPRSILFTSSTVNEGKTSTAINLACAYVLLGKKVLLVDADLRNPSIDSRLLKTPRKIGLSSYLSGQSNPAEITVTSKISDRLFVIPSGRSPKNPVELLASEKMEKLIDLAKERFDIVIVDSPPVGNMSDAIILSNFVDATILSVQINKTSINDLSQALSRLANMKGNLLGVVATDIKTNYSVYRSPQPFFPVLTKYSGEL